MTLQENYNPRSQTGILFIHGLTGNPTEMKPVARVLEKAGYRTEVPLLPGHGAGVKEMLMSTHKEWLEGLREAYRGLATSCSKVFVCGLCASAGLAVALASEVEDLAGVVLISTQFRKISKDMPATRHLLPLGSVFPFLRRICYWTEKPPYGVKDKGLQQMITSSIEESKQNKSKDYGTFRTYVETIYQSQKVASIARNNAPKVRCPALVIHSLEDSWFGIDNAAEVYTSLGSIDKSVVLLSGCDHVLTIDLRKNEVARQVLQFVDHRALTEQQQNEAI